MSYLRLKSAYRKNTRHGCFAIATDSKSSVAPRHSVGHAGQVAAGLESLVNAKRLSQLDLGHD